MLIRRNIADGDLASFTTWCPAGTTIETLVNVEGRRFLDLAHDAIAAGVAEHFLALPGKPGLGANDDARAQGPPAIALPTISSERPKP
jgi:hypothetical protein